MKILYLKVALFLTACLPLSSYCQDNDRNDYGDVICNFNLPPGKNGLTVSSFMVHPTIRIERPSGNIILEIKKTQSTAANPNPSYTHSYTYNGRQYGNQHIGFGPFVPVKAINLTYEVRVAYGSQSWTKRVDGQTNQFGPIDKDAKASEVSVYVKVVNLMFDGTGQIENEIRNLLKKEQAARTPPVEQKPQNPVVARAPEIIPAGTKPVSSQTAKTATVPEAKTNQPTAKTASNMVNGIDRSTLPALAMDKNGNHYQKDANNNYTKISATDYQALKKQQAAQKAAVTANNTTSASLPVAPTTPAANDPLAHFNSAASTTAYGGNPLQNYTSSSSSKFERNMNTATSIVNAAAPLLDQWAANRQQKNEERQRLREAEEQRESELAAAAAAERERVYRLTEARKNFIASYKDGKLPLSSEKINEDEIHFFCYSYDAASVGTNNPRIAVSTVFPIARYGDGTWPFTNNVKASIVKANNGTPVVLVGYYTSLQAAQDAHTAFVNESGRHGFAVAELAHKAKKSSAITNADFWGNATPGKETTAAPAKKATATADSELDFWGNSLNNKAKPAEQSKKTTTVASSQPSDKKQDGELDFWGNSPNNKVKPAEQPKKTVAVAKSQPLDKEQDGDIDFWGNATEKPVSPARKPAVTNKK